MDYLSYKPEIERILKKGMTYEPPNPAGWAFKPSWRFGRIHFSPQTFDELLRFAAQKLGIDNSMLEGRRTLQVVESEMAINELSKTLERLGANPYTVGEIVQI